MSFRLTPGGVKRTIRRLGVIAVCTYIATCLGIAAFQRSLIYFPHKPYEGTPRDCGLNYDEVQLITEDGVQISAWWVPAATSKPASKNGAIFEGNPPASPLGKGGGDAPDARQATDDRSTTDDSIGSVFIFFHGNAGNISHRIDKLVDLHRRGVSTLIVDYRGYGRSEGTPTEAGLCRDADAAWKYLTDSKRIAPNRIVLFGESLGGAVAIDVAVRKNAAALVVECTFSRLADVGHVHYPLVPVSWFLIDRFDSLSKIPQVKCPKLFLHSAEDRLVPIKLARQLFDAALPPKQFIITPGDHNEAGFSYSPQYGDAMMAFLRENMQK